MYGRLMEDYRMIDSDCKWFMIRWIKGIKEVILVVVCCMLWLCIVVLREYFIFIVVFLI